MKVGSIVKLRVQCLGNPVGTLGVAYEAYDIGHPGLSFVFENGNYDGFDPQEQKDFLEEVGFDSIISMYQFRNVMQLDEDFRRGMFKSAFTVPECFKPKNKEDGNS